MLVSGVATVPGDTGGVVASSTPVGVIVPGRQTGCGAATGIPGTGGGVVILTGIGDGFSAELERTPVRHRLDGFSISRY